MFCSECLNCVNKCFVLNVSVKSTSSSHPRSRHQSLECNSLLRSHHRNSSHPCTHITPSIQFSSVHPFLCEVLFVFTTTVLYLFITQVVITTFFKCIQYFCTCTKLYFLSSGIFGHNTLWLFYKGVGFFCREQLQGSLM